MSKKLISVFMAAATFTVTVSASEQTIMHYAIEEENQAKEDMVSIHQVNMATPITLAELVITIVNTTGEELYPIMDTHYALPAMQLADDLGIIDLEDYPMEIWSQPVTEEEFNAVLTGAMQSGAVDMGEVYSALNQIMVDTIIVDGTVVELGELTVSHQNGKLMLPVRVVAEALGFEVSWEPRTYTATLTKGDIESTLQVGYGTYTYTVEGEETVQSLRLDETPRMIDGVLYAPLEYFELFAETEVSDNTLHLTMRK